MRATLPRPVTRLAATLGVAATLLTAFGATQAQAAYDNWSCNLGGVQYCLSNRHSLRAVGISSPAGLNVAAGASWTTSSGDLYGNWALGAGYACHSYGGGNVLYPLVLNNSWTPSFFQAGSTYGAGADAC